MNRDFQFEHKFLMPRNLLMYMVSFFICEAVTLFFRLLYITNDHKFVGFSGQHHSLVWAQLPAKEADDCREPIMHNESQCTTNYTFM